MHTLRTLVAALVILALALPAAAAPQDRHAISPSALAQAVAGDVAARDADRATIREALARPQVRELATTMGVDLDRVDASIDTLNPEGLTRTAKAADEVNRALVGGASTVVISTTTIILVLVIVILVLLID